MYKNTINYDNGWWIVEITCSHPDGHTETRKVSMQTESTARIFASNNKKKWIISEINRFVNHAIILSVTGNSLYYNTQKRHDCLLRLTDFLKGAESYDLFHLAAKILILEQEMVGILPASGNTSFLSSMDKMHDIIDVCRLAVRKKQTPVLAPPS